MDIFTALIGDDLSGIQKTVTGTSKEQVQQEAKSQKSDEEQAALFSDQVEATENEFCGHNDWNWIDHQFFDGFVLRCEQCRTWLFIGQDETLFFRSLEDEQCQECGGDLFPFNQRLNQCVDCDGFIDGERFIEADQFRSMASFDLQVENSA